MPALCADAFCSDLQLVHEAVRSGVTVQRASAHVHHWERWVSYCSPLGLDPYLSDYTDPVPILQVFAQRYRDGRLAPSNRTVKSRTVEDVLRAVAQKYTSMGAPDPRLNAFGKVDFRLTRQLRAYKLGDDPPARVKPVPITLILHILRAAHTLTPSDSARAIADSITIAFYFLLRPGEYTGTTHSDQPFLLRDVHLSLGSRKLDTFLSPLAELTAATAASYTFTRQKNGIGNETLSHGRSGHPLGCPVLATLRLLLYHRSRHSPPHTPLASYYQADRLVRVTPRDVTTHLKAAATALLPITGIPPAELSARSLRAGGAMALLCADIDTDVIKLLGRWHSDSMIRYLHVQAQPITHRMAARMFNNGQYSFLPADTVPLLPV
jgi:hypothetical protein